MWSALALCHLWHVHPTSAGVAVMALYKLSTGECGERQVQVAREQVEPDGSTAMLWEKDKGKAHPTTLRDGLGQHSGN